MRVKNLAMKQALVTRFTAKKAFTSTAKPPITMLKSQTRPMSSKPLRTKINVMRSPMRRPASTCRQTIIAFSVMMTSMKVSPLMY